VMASAEGLEPSRTRKNSNKNIIARIRHGHITGRGICRGTEALLKERDHKAQWHGIPVLLRRLYDKSHLNSDLSQIYFIIKEVSSFLSMEAMSFVTEDRKPAQESTYPNTYTFDLFGGVDLLVEILMRPTLTTQTNVPKMSDDLVKDCLSVLYNCCICVKSVFINVFLTHRICIHQCVPYSQNLYSSMCSLLTESVFINVFLTHRIGIHQCVPYTVISSESSDESSLAASPLRHRLPQSMKIVHEIMFKVEVLYVLCVLLVGRQRNQVHRMLAEFKLIPGLNNLFDKLIWRKQTSTHVLHSQNQNCDCSPEISFKIQFLRLLQSFSDHHENLICDGKKGLLTRLISVMKKEPPDSSFRFWQARAVESFLRGTTSYADQVFLLKRGLLEHILFCIIDSGCKSRDVLQSYFDLLGELMKFNMDAFKKFNRYVNSDEKFQTFMTQINSSLVDSNMLVRCIILSLDRFEGQTEDMRVVEVLSECRLLSYMARVENRLTFLFRLVNIINVQTLTQENVSCLNTSLVVLMLARRRGTLPFYLNALREKEYAEKYPGCLLNNFHNLLRFWQRHYLNKDKDSTCLENSSCIPFTYWKETVSVLLGSDRTSLCAIASYIDEAYMDLGKDFLENGCLHTSGHVYVLYFCICVCGYASESACVRACYVHRRCRTGCVCW
uniref:Transient receptor potential cation channel, subfamily C, member 4 associated protein a n=1 Tax=Esox lucius TaxID=8010 RepID=A0A3P8Y685_ESOLU